METRIESLHFDANQNLLDYVNEKTSELELQHSRIENCNVVLKHDKNSENKDKFVEVSVSIPGNTLFAEAQSETFELATDMVIDKIKKQLNKTKKPIVHTSIDTEIW